MQEASAADVAELRRTLAATEQRCAEALRQLDRMRRRDRLRERQAASLTEAVEKAQRFAYHDELTRLPNRRSLLDHFNLAVALAARHNQHVGLLFIDLDHFKEVNDTLGHPAGDELLRQVAVRLGTCLRASDTACRYGGDEFVVLLPELDGKNGAVVVAHNIRERLGALYLINDVQIAMTASVGIAMHPGDALSYADLVAVADRAMYRDKARCPPALSISRATIASVRPHQQRASREVSPPATTPACRCRSNCSSSSAP
jgi:diguanylate cyclase